VKGFRREYDLVNLIADEALEDSGNHTTYRFEKFGVDGMILKLFRD
jgi:hypothetical protein